MPKTIISSEKAPAAIGPYSQAVEANGIVFLSGQIPLVPETGLVEEGGFEAQARRVLSNFEAVLAAAGLGWGDVVKTIVFLTDLGQFQVFNEIYAEKINCDPPARAVVQVSALPRGAEIEMEGVALKGL